MENSSRNQALAGRVFILVGWLVALKGTLPGDCYRSFLFPDLSIGPIQRSNGATQRITPACGLRQDYLYDIIREKAMGCSCSRSGVNHLNLLQCERMMGMGCAYKSPLPC